jgi:propionyl-CoA synthetase
MSLLSTIDLALWTEASKKIDWIEPPTEIISSTNTWFPGGRLNTCYNALDRHCQRTPNGLALIWDSPMTQTKQTFTYAKTLDHVQTLAGVLRSYGVGKGDPVLLYMPMVPETVFTFLACARLGAVHCAVFGKLTKKIKRRMSCVHMGM